MIPELIALAVNVAHSSGVAEVCTADGAIPPLLRLSNISSKLRFLATRAATMSLLRRVSCRSLETPTALLLLCCRGLVLQWFHEGERFERLLQRALATADELAWKLVRNLAGEPRMRVCGREGRQALQGVRADTCTHNAHDAVLGATVQVFRPRFSAPASSVHLGGCYWASATPDDLA